MANILLVDDDSVILEVMKSALEKEGHAVLNLENGMDAIERFNKELFDLVITDVNMPFGVSGFDLITTIRKSSWNNQVPVVFLTGRNDKRDIDRAIQAGIDDYFIKPVDIMLILAKVEELLKDKKPVHQFTETAIHISCTWLMDFSLVGLSEQGLMIESTIPIPLNTKLKIESEIFDMIGIRTPKLRVSACSANDKVKDKYYIKTSFIGLNMAELQKVRLWCWQSKKRRMVT